VTAAVRVGAKLANFGPDAHRLLAAAETLELAGADSLWLSDRLVTVSPTSSPYPFAADGAVPWTDNTPFLEAVAALAMAAAVTSRVELGIGVLVAAVRHPVVLAKQLSTVAALSGGRVAVGIGSGWMAEEFEAVAVPFAERGDRTHEVIELLRACWTGMPDAYAGRYHRLPKGVAMYPTPPRRIPILAGGMSTPALRRAGAVDGWYGYMFADRIDTEIVRAAAGGGGRIVVRLVGPLERALPAARELAAAGATELVLDIDAHPETAAAQIGRARTELS
jgi:alkanesulfonate monooxygenase SsuD/methylene tetrahydromethanopterin reductase-like flavin-dependent oxidoreductase (luciferase family)